MAELPENIRRVGGRLDTHKRPFGRRVLLPTEVELCEVLGINEQEYWLFVDQTEAYSGERKEGYELIPDIRCDPISTFLGTVAFGGITYGQIALAIVMTAVGYVLTPKPKPLKSGESRRSSDSIGSKKFAPQNSFNSVQELANIGDVVPLLFTNQTEESTGIAGKNKYIGGTRVNGQLLWSQLLSLGNAQQLKAIVLFSLGEIDDDTDRPDFAGYAIGDLLLSSYSHKKLDLFFKSSPYGTADNRLSIDDKYSDSGITGMDYAYPEDVFADRWPISARRNNAFPIWPFSGTRNPTTQATFGAYNPMPNANVVKLNYQLTFPTKGSDKKADAALGTKGKKISAFWPTRAGFSGADTGELTVKDNLITYTILESSQQNVDNYLEGYKPHGVEDVISMVKSIREMIDQNISVGESFLAGDAIISCTKVETIKGLEGVPWRPTLAKKGEEQSIKDLGIRRVFHFRVQETGSDYEGFATGSFVCNPGTGGLDKHAANPQWNDETRKRGNQQMKLFQKVGATAYDDSTKYGFAYRNPILQRVAIGTITNNRACSQTEIGLKSRVYGHIRGANLNSQPSQAELTEMFNDKVQFQLGNIDQYLKRFSFFYVQIRKAGTNDDWQTLLNTEPNHTGLFCVRGNTPEYQYNYIRISHPNPFTQFEFRFKPYPGNNIPILHLNKKVNLLYAKVTNQNDKDENFTANLTFGTANVSFKGFKDFVLTESEIQNTEWKIAYNTGEMSTALTGGPVTEFSNYKTGTDDLELPTSNVTIVANDVTVTPTYDYAYQVTEERKSITLISLDMKHSETTGEEKWAWIAYVDGEEVGHTVVDAGTPSTEISIVGNNGNTYTPDIHPHIVKHPEDESIPVHYYKLNEQPNLTITTHDSV